MHLNWKPTSVSEAYKIGAVKQWMRLAVQKIKLPKSVTLELFFKS